MIEDSTLGFNVIDGLPTDSGAGMSTTMTELNRRAAVEVFRASLPRRFGKWNGVWKRFERLVGNIAQIGAPTQAA